MCAPANEAGIFSIVIPNQSADWCRNLRGTIEETTVIHPQSAFGCQLLLGGAFWGAYQPPNEESTLDKFLKTGMIYWLESF